MRAKKSIFYINDKFNIICTVEYLLFRGDYARCSGLAYVKCVIKSFNVVVARSMH